MAHSNEDGGCNQIESGLEKRHWTHEEDDILTKYVHEHGEGNWHLVQRLYGLQRDSKSCRFRWVNYLQKELKKGSFTKEEEDTIDRLQNKFGNRWTKIASYLPGRTDNAIKNNWNTRHSSKSNAKKRQRSEQPADIPTSVDRNTPFLNSSHSSIYRYQAMLDQLPQLQFPPTNYPLTLPTQIHHGHANYDSNSHDQTVNENSGTLIQEPEIPSFHSANNIDNNNNSGMETPLIRATDLPSIQNVYDNRTISPIRQDSDDYWDSSLLFDDVLVDSGMAFIEGLEEFVRQLP